MLATCYLPRRWPSKYFRLCRSLRPCSGWERVVYLRLATKKLFNKTFSYFLQSCYRFRYTQNCTRYKLYASSIFNLTLNYCFTLRCRSFHFAYAKLSFTQLRDTSAFRFVYAPLQPTQSSIRKSPRPISNAWLKMLPLLHLHPINVVIYNGTY